MNKKVLLLVIVAMMVIASNVWAADVVWLGNGAGDPCDWFNPNNWDTVVPGSGDKAKINLVTAGYGPIISAPAPNVADVNQLYIAESAGTVPGAQTLKVLAGGVLNVNAEAVLGYGADEVNDVNDDGTLFVDGGTVNCQHLFVGYDPDANGHLHIDSGTVDVNQMFGLSWNGGKGYAQLDGGTLITEQFTFEKVAGGTASMNITGGTWIQKHFWWDKIRSLVWNGKITGYGERKKVIVTWDPNANDPNEDRTIVTATNTPTYPNFITVIQGGGGNYTKIQDALNDPNLAACGVIEVQDNATYNGNGTGHLVFPNDVNYLTLQAGSGFSPTIEVSGADKNDVYIGMMAVGQTIQGFNINFIGSAYPTDNNSTMILSDGGASTVRDCNITGPAVGWIRGITNVATIEDTEISGGREAIVCDLNEVASGFRYSITGSHIHDTRYRGISFLDCNAVMDDCLVERCGGSLLPGEVGGCVRVADGNTSDPDGTTNLLITNSILRKALFGRNFNMETIGTATIEDSIIMDTLGTATHNDEILQYRGTLNLNRCIIKAGGPMGRSAVNMTAPSTGQKVAICNINHCDIWDTNAVNQWGVFTTDASHLLTVRNTIFTGEYGLLANVVDTIDSNWNDVSCDVQDYGLHAVAGPNDISVDPLYIQTDDANLDTFFALQPYSPVVNADEDGNYMGSQGPMTGYEVYPGDLDGDGGVDFNDFAVLAQHWRDNNTIPAVNDVVLETFESYTSTGASGVIGTLLGPRVVGTPDAWRVVPEWGYGADWLYGTSTLSLLTDPNDANEGSKAMRWVYDVNVNPDVNKIQYTEILVVLAAEVNFDPYNEIRVALNRDANNSPGIETFMYAKFLNDIYGTYGKGGSDLEEPDKMDVANSVVAGDTLGMYPNEYRDWTIDFDNLAGWTWGHNNLQHVGAIIFGIRTQSEKPYGVGTGIIDVDYMRLVDRPACSGNPAGDLNSNCEVTLDDLKSFTDYWLMGK